MNSFFIRVVFLLLHAVLNFVAISWLLNFDITSKWVYFIGFILLIFLLVYLFINHIISFIYFLKTRTK